MSRTLFGYVAKLYLLLFAGALGAVLVIFLVADFGDRLRMFLDRPYADVALLYANKAVVALHQLAPAAMLLAAGATVSTLRRRGEWTAMQAVGASRWTIVAPIALCTGALALGLVAFDELAVTDAGTRVDTLLAERFDEHVDYRVYYAPKQWFRVGDDVFHVRGDAERDGTLHDVTVFRMDRDFELRSRLDAEALRPLGGARWALEGVVQRDFLPGGASPRAEAAHLELELPGTSPSSFAIRAGRPELMRLRELVRQERIRASVGLPTQRFWLAVHNRFAYPLTGLAAAMLAVALGLRPARQGHLTMALVEGLIVAVLLFSLILVGKTLVLAGHLPAWVAAWGPIVGLLAAVVALWLRAEGRLRPSRA